MLLHVCIDQVDIRVQPTGTFGSPFPGEDQNGFPGVRIPTSLVAVARSLEGVIFEVDPTHLYSDECDRNLRFRFAWATKNQGPLPGREWALEADVYSTTNDLFRWKPGAGANAFAYSIGQRFGDVLSPYEETYRYPETGVDGSARYWLAFVLKVIP
jgi:hypothetical protein